MNFRIETGTLTPEEFIALSKSVGWGRTRIYNMEKVAFALKSSALTVVVRNEQGQALGCGRVFSDDLLMSFTPDIFVDPAFQKKGIGRIIVQEMKNKFGHTSFFFGAQPGNESFFENLGFEKSLQSFAGRFKKNPYYS